MVISKIVSSVDAPALVRPATSSSYLSPLASAEAKIVGFVVTPTTCFSDDQLGEVAGLDALAGEVVEPDAHSRGGQVGQRAGRRGLLVCTHRSLQVADVSVARAARVTGCATLMLSSAAETTAAAVIPNFSNSSV